MNSVPIYYDYANVINSQIEPSTLHAQDNNMAYFFRKYLLEKAMSVFTWDVPYNWDKAYFLYNLYCNGFVAVVDTAGHGDYGVIPQGCSLSGFNVFYRPNRALIVNPCINPPFDSKYVSNRIDLEGSGLLIGKECAIIRLQPNYSGILDIVNYYANLLAMSAETISSNLFNSKLSYVFGAKSKSFAESFKKMYDQIASGEPAVVIDKNLFNEDGSQNWQIFNNNLKSTYLVTDILNDMGKIEAQFDTEIGIPNANTDKRERLITDEVNANNVETMSRCAMWLEEVKRGLEDVKALYDIDVKVDWRVTPEEIKENKEAENV